MCLDDYMKYFGRTTICSLTPDVDSDGIPDPLSLTINGYIPLVVHIIQRFKHRKYDQFSIRADVYKILGKELRFWTTELLGENTRVYKKAVQLVFRYRIHPGEYLLIPTTGHEKQEKEFLLRIFTACPLNDIRKVGPEVTLCSCDQETYVEQDDQIYALTLNTTLFGQWIAGENAGGQIGNQDTFATNPQYAFSVQDKDEPVVFHLLQHPTSTHTVGILVIPLKTDPPVSSRYLYRNFDSCLLTVDGKATRFLPSLDVEARYVLPPGGYLAMVFTDAPNTETMYSLLVRSQTDLSIMEYHTGTVSRRSKRNTEKNEKEKK
ncbi:calpain-10-like isoform X3 [Gigantopelta aegis]|uniref:calpain-10-like isoform X3 n=1 Tax=Gigantopelta aegis TaxID=1735272 RepID=UPI001B88B279|nr:calpain-10-like isoform X3 [Gigantopelta aegis]